MRIAGDALILIGQAEGRIHDEQRHVGAIDRTHGAHEPVILDILVDLGLAAQAGRVDDRVESAFMLDRRIDRVARRARDVAHDGAFFADQTIRKRALPRIRTADDGHVDDVLALLGLALGNVADDVDHGIQQIARTVPVLG